MEVDDPAKAVDCSGITTSELDGDTLIRREFLHGDQNVVNEGSGEEELSLSGAVKSDAAKCHLQKFTLLYDKYNKQFNEVERLEKTNGELKEQLEKVRRERDNAQELLRFCQNKCTVQCDVLERRILNAELQLKMTSQREQARELHHQQYIKRNNEKWDQKVVKLVKRMETAEKERNDAVCRYAAKEAEIMHLQALLQKLEESKNTLAMERDALRKSTQFERLQEYKHLLAEAERQLALERQANEESEEQHRMTVKHLEASQTALTELRSRLDSVQSQLVVEKMEKEHFMEELKRAQSLLMTVEQHCVEEVDAAKKQSDNQQVLCRDVCSELSTVKLRNATLFERMEFIVQTNAQLQAECQQLRQQCAQIQQLHQNDLEKLRSLEEMQTEMNKNLHRAELAESALVDAAAERDQAEVEATECRKLAERMLVITDQLAEKNSTLTSQQETFKAKNLELSEQVKILETSVSTYEKRVTELERTSELLKVDSSAEIATLRGQIEASIAKERQLNAVISTLRNEQAVLKKKNASSIKELRAEVQYLRKLQSRNLDFIPQNTSLGDHLSLSVIPNGVAGQPTSSRASSIESSSDMYTGTDCACSTNGGTAAIQQKEEVQQLSPTLSSSDANHVQQQMIEKIVKLQRLLARRQDKIEFLEEHVQQCTQELLKKTKIIQNYALREEAALLLPEVDLNEVHHRGAIGNGKTSSFFMGILFSNNANGADQKSELGKVVEINLRLQAVLEDLLDKNITLKSSIDALGEEISRLSRENRQLALSKVT